MCITILVHDNLFSGLFNILCVIKQIYIVLLRILASSYFQWTLPNQNLQHHTDGHQPGKAEGLDLFAQSHATTLKKAPMLHPGLGQATTSFYDESSRLAMKEPTASSCVLNTKR